MRLLCDFGLFWALWWSSYFWCFVSWNIWILLIRLFWISIAFIKWILFFLFVCGVWNWMGWSVHNFWLVVYFLSGPICGNWSFLRQWRVFHFPHSAIGLLDLFDSDYICLILRRWAFLKARMLNFDRRINIWRQPLLLCTFATKVRINKILSAHCTSIILLHFYYYYIILKIKINILK